MKTIWYVLGVVVVVAALVVGAVEWQEEITKPIEVEPVE